MSDNLKANEYTSRICTIRLNFVFFLCEITYKTTIIIIIKITITKSQLADQTARGGGGYFSLRPRIILYIISIRGIIPLYKSSGDVSPSTCIMFIDSRSVYAISAKPTTRTRKISDYASGLAVESIYILSIYIRHNEKKKHLTHIIYIYIYGSVWVLYLRGL